MLTLYTGGGGLKGGGLGNVKRGWMDFSSSKYSQTQKKNYDHSKQRCTCPIISSNGLSYHEAVLVRALCSLPPPGAQVTTLTPSVV